MLTLPVSFAWLAGESVLHSGISFYFNHHTIRNRTPPVKFDLGMNHQAA